MASVRIQKTRRVFTRFAVGAALIYLLLGLLTSVLVSWTLSLITTVRPFTATDGRYDPDGMLWRVTCEFGPTSMFVLSLRQREVMRAWGPEQIIGPANAPKGVDSERAWASKNQDDRGEWIKVTFAAGQPAVRIHVHESYCPGAVSQITLHAKDGAQRTAWQRGPTTGPSSQPTGPIEIDPPLEAVSATIDIDSKGVPGWNEIDAVELTLVDGSSAWATYAEASTTYAAPISTSGNPEQLLPSWSRIDRSADLKRDLEALNVQYEERAYGWPLVVMVEQIATPIQSLSGQSAAQATSTAGPLVAKPSVRLTSLTGGLPLRPIFANLALCALFYAACLFLLRVVMTWPLRVAREVLRMRRGRCPRCGYDLRYNFAGGCSECGFLRDQPQAPPG